MVTRVSQLFIARSVSLLMRVVYACLILAALLMHDNKAVLFNSAVFLVTTITWVLPDKHALWYDALLVALFAECEICLA